MEALWKQAELRIAAESGRRRCDLVHAERTARCHLDPAREDRTTPVSVVHPGGQDRAAQVPGGLAARGRPASLNACSYRATRARTPLIVGGELLRCRGRRGVRGFGDVLCAEEPVAAEASDELERASVV